MAGLTGQVRDGRDDDVDAVAAIFEHYVRTTVSTFETEAPSAEQWRSRWADLRARGWPVVVADDAGTVVGFAYAAPWRDKPAYRHTVDSTVYVAPGARGHGWGPMLLGAVHERAAAAGARQIIAFVAESGDDASLLVHRRLGFRDVGTLTDVGRKFGRWIDVRMLQKTVPDS